MSSPKLNPANNSDQMRNHDASEAELHNEHELVTALRSIIRQPDKHTIGGLSEVVLRSLAELSLLKDSLDVMMARDDVYPRVPSGSGSDPIGEAGAMVSAAKA
jgi:hypothetical protein